jgi:hypothetical protein
MNGLKRYLILDVFASAIALLALAGTAAAISMSPAVRLQSGSSPGATASSRAAVLNVTSRVFDASLAGSSISYSVNRVTQ